MTILRDARERPATVTLRNAWSSCGTPESVPRPGILERPGNLRDARERSATPGGQGSEPLPQGMSTRKTNAISASMSTLVNR